MIEALKDVLVVNLYWLSLPFIGYGLLLVAQRSKWLTGGMGALVATVMRQHVFVAFLLSFSVSAAVLGTFALVCYIGNFSARTYGTFYVALLIVSLAGYVKLLGQRVFSVEDINFFGTKKHSVLVKLVFALLCVAIFFDFLAGVYVMSHAAFGSDTYVHLSRIVTILSQGFTTESGFFKGVAESGYHYNLIYALYTVPSYLFSITPSESWKYSFGFFRLVQWMALFALAGHIWRYWLYGKPHTLLAASLATLLAISLFGGNDFYIATYPNLVVNIWLILLVLGLDYYDRRIKASALPVLIPAFLVTMTHPIYGLMAAIFLGLLIIVKVLVKGLSVVRDKQTLTVYFSAIFILLLGPLRTALYPNRMTENGFSISEFKTIDIGFLSIKQPTGVLSGSFLDAIVLIIGLIGFAYLLYRLHSTKDQFSIAATLILFFPLLVYTPFAFSILQSLFPHWLIDRFTSMNVLRYISVALGLYSIGALALYAAKRYGHFAYRRISQDRFILIIVGVIIVLASFFLLVSYKSIAQYKGLNELAYEKINRTHNSFRNILKDESMVVAESNDSYFLTAILPINVIAVEENHTTPTADPINRLKCQEHLLRYMSYEDFFSVGAQYMVLSRVHQDYARQRNEADSKAYLGLAAENEDYIVYRIIKEGVSTLFRDDPHSACLQFQKIEKQT